ncbi:putative palmitoyltransferase with autoacylation activity Pfa4 [Aspergillus candidus]|uniref:Palmitoyltransferase PFA4 n=1 Tax=Aspergillus candidus TaxID=41067 RepID=A0A2I2F918_ASPCN|nr:palmitoyltransferase pfa4 [Aspergillus candidus]PLB37127.1 palmitoyltransferase pfa4 [Aspergillus candidus]
MLCSAFSISQLAIPSVSLLISFLAYTSQYLLLNFEPAPITDRELLWVNVFALCIWICYYRACSVDPGRIPKGWRPQDSKQLESDRASGRSRWCRRCEAFKPPRAHHCKTCQRCIPKMDHHCPWTSNCVSHFTFPHFIRFLFYAVTGMTYLETCLWERGAIIWASRNHPSYMGPSVIQIGHLFILFVVNSLTIFVLSILLARTAWSLIFNTTVIETWEIERHETLVRRAKHFHGYLTSPHGTRVHIRKQEFPYDIGIWDNIKAGMGGSSNVLGWFWPLSRTSNRSTGLEFETNGFENSNLSWPPPDPDRIPMSAPRARGSISPDPEASGYVNSLSPSSGPSRTRNDLAIQRRRRFHQRIDQKTDEAKNSAESSSADSDQSDDGEQAWRNSEGERLRDFGVDEDAEFYDEEDIPLAILVQQRAQAALKQVT